MAAVMRSLWRPNPTEIGGETTSVHLAHDMHLHVPTLKTERPMPDIGILIGLVLFALTGANGTLEAAPSSCAADTEDACLQTSHCDVFGDGPVATCEVACDARASEEACGQNSACAWSEGHCQYEELAEPGC